MFVDTLNGMLAQMRYHHRDREEVMRESVEMRLNKSLQTYFHDLTQTADYLSRRDEERVLRTMNRGEQDD